MVVYCWLLFNTLLFRHEKKVYIPHTSVLSKAPKIATWLVFDELVKTKNNFAIKGITAISPITVTFPHILAEHL